jgi:very-long-chain (3R)-3-hydroxyacyl-CoA dehydratase
MKENEKQISHKNKRILDTLNFFQFFGWSLILNLFFLLCFTKLLNLVDEKVIYNIEKCLFFVLKVTQTMQGFELIMPILKIGGGSIFSSAAQLSSRLLITYMFMDPRQSLLKIGLILVPWSLSDLIRALFYINKNSQILGDLRYNFFIVLYPLGLTGEITMIEQYLIIGNSNILFFNTFYFVRIIQFCFALGFIILYIHMISQRKKYYKNKIKSQ